MQAGSLRFLIALFVCLLIVVGCAGKKKVQLSPKDPGVLYSKGMVLFNQQRYKKAEEVFTQLKNYFPSDELYALKADLRIADCYYHRKEYPEAITRYMEFKRRSPFHQDIPYVEFQIGSSYYKQILSKDRDQESTVNALNAFENVVSNYPDTIFAQKAKEKIEFCRQRLAEHEYCIAKFYMRKRNYGAAAERFDTVLRKYPACGLDDEALYALAVALHEQKRDGEALSFLIRLNQEYPNSPLVEKGEKLRASLRAKGIVAMNPTHGEKVLVAKAPNKSKMTNMPFRIRSQTVETILDKNATMYSGDVVARGKAVVIRSEFLLVTNGEDGVPEEMVARGDVRVTGGGEEVLCKKAVWFPDRQIVVMTGDAKIKSPEGWIRGDEITLQLTTGKIDIEGKWVEGIEEIQR